MPKRRVTTALVAALTLIALVSVACGSSSSKTAKAAPGFDGKTIRVGVLTALTGPAAVIGKQLANGSDVYWKYVNNEKLVAGKYKVEVVVEDTQYATNTTVQMYNKDKGNVTMFSQVMGTPSVLALLPLLKQDNIIVSPASQDALWVREPQLMPIIQPYQIDAINGLTWFNKEGGGQGKTVGVIMQNDAYGEAGLEGAQYAASKLGFDIKTITRFKVGDQDFTAQVSQLQNSGVQLVYAVVQPTEFGKILGTAAKMNYKPQWMGQSPSWIAALGQTALKPYLEGLVYITSVGPNLDDRSVPGMAALLDRTAKYAPTQQPDPYFNFGYLQAQAVDQVLEKAAANGDFSRAGLKKAMETVGALHFDGILGDYQYGTAATRNPPRDSTVYKINMTKAGGLDAVKHNFTTPEAQSFVFPQVNGS